MPLKVMTIVGTRPELIKLSCIIAEMDRCFNHVLVHTGQNFDFELNGIFFEDLGIRTPDHFLNAAKESSFKTIGEVVIASGEIMIKEKPDAVLIYGDTNSCLAVISAKKLQIPIFHLEAGNRCFDQRVPEEVNRKIVDHLSDINFVHSEHARRYLLSEGIRPEHIFKSGSPMREIYLKNQEKIERSKTLESLGLEKQEYFVVSIHREENVDYEKNFLSLIRSLNVVAEKFQKKIIVSTHPRTRKKLENLKGQQMNSLIDFMKPLGFIDYVTLQKNAFCVLSDSGTLTEEASLLQFPGVMIRQAHERPEGMDSGVVVMSGLNAERIVDSIHIVRDRDLTKVQSIQDYQTENVSGHVVSVIQSYTDYINRIVWRKDV